MRTGSRRLVTSAGARHRWATLLAIVPFALAFVAGNVFALHVGQASPQADVVSTAAGHSEERGDRHQESAMHVVGACVGLLASGILLVLARHRHRQLRSRDTVTAVAPAPLRTLRGAWRAPPALSPPVTSPVMRT